MVLDASKYLYSFGWKGDGHALSSNGIAKPITVEKKNNTNGLGKDRNESYEWWDNIFDNALKGVSVNKDGDMIKVVQKSKDPERNNMGIISYHKPRHTEVVKTQFYSSFVEEQITMKNEKCALSTNTIIGTETTTKLARSVECSDREGLISNKDKKRKLKDKIIKSKKIDVEDSDQISTSSTHLGLKKKKKRRDVDDSDQISTSSTHSILKKKKKRSDVDDSDQVSTSTTHLGLKKKKKRSDVDDSDQVSTSTTDSILKKKKKKRDVNDSDQISLLEISKTVKKKRQSKC